jgi:hypothetical protein
VEAQNQVYGSIDLAVVSDGETEEYSWADITDAAEDEKSIVFEPLRASTPTKM